MATTVLATDMSEDRTAVSDGGLFIVYVADFHNEAARILYMFLRITTEGRDAWTWMTAYL